RDTFHETTVSVYGDYTQLFWPMAYAIFERRKQFEKQVESLSDKDKKQFFKENSEARGLLRPSGPPRLFEQRKKLMADFHKVAGSKKNVARIKEWYQSNKELLGTLDELRGQGALDIGDL
ncbi:MAG TPA: hypothetical protein VGB77_21455, partial [Abditibacteriaceae bacterium]